MIINKETTIAYHCPACGYSIIGEANIFLFINKMLKLRCECGDSEMVLRALKDGRIKISVPCIVCPNLHSFTLSSNALFSRDTFTLSCSLSGISICFFGEREKTVAELERTENELIELFAAENQIADENDNFFREIKELYNKTEKDLLKNSDYWDNDYDCDDYDDDDDEEEEFNELLNIFAGLGGEQDGTDSDPGEDEPSFSGSRQGGARSKEFSLYKSPARSAGSQEVEGERDDLFKNKAIAEGALREIASKIQSGHVVCSCFLNGGKPDLSLTAGYNELHIKCVRCGDERRFAVSTPDDFEYIADMEYVMLDGNDDT